MQTKIKTLINQSEQHFQNLHYFFQYIFIGFFSIILIVGLVIVLPLPELGIPLILISLGVLSFKYKWAKQLLSYFEKLFSNKVVKIVGLVVGLILVLVSVLLWA